MFTIKNLLKISLVLFVFFIISCKPVAIDEDLKAIIGAFAYKKGDSLQMFIVKNNNITDTVNFIVKDIGFDFISSTDFGTVELERGNIVLSDSMKKVKLYVYTEVNLFSIDITKNIPPYDKLFLFSYTERKNNMPEFYEQKEIDGVTYDSVYFLTDTAYSGLINYLYSSRNYGFIKFWNDTVTIKFER